MWPDQKRYSFLKAKYSIFFQLYFYPKLDGYFSERFPDFLHTDYPRYNAGINCTFVGPGHGTPIKLANGSDFWYVYHTWKFGAVGTEIPGRVMNIDQIQWTSDGWPVIGIPSDTPKLVPNIGNFWKSLISGTIFPRRYATSSASSCVYKLTYKASSKIKMCAFGY